MAVTLTLCVCGCVWLCVAVCGCVCLCLCLSSRRHAEVNRIQESELERYALQEEAVAHAKEAARYC